MTIEQSELYEKLDKDIKANYSEIEADKIILKKDEARQHEQIIQIQQHYEAIISLYKHKCKILETIIENKKESK